MSAAKHPQSKTPRKLAFKPRLAGRERRAALLRIALDAFAETGYKDTSMSAIAARANVDKAMLYRYFTSKQARSIWPSLKTRPRRAAITSLNACSQPKSPAHGS